MATDLVIRREQGPSKGRCFVRVEGYEAEMTQSRRGRGIG